VRLRQAAAAAVQARLRREERWEFASARERDEGKRDTGIGLSCIMALCSFCGGRGQESVPACRSAFAARATPRRMCAINAISVVY
jgi:hypothetical protein